MQFTDQTVNELGIMLSQNFGIRLDAKATRGFARNLEYVMAKVYERRYPELMGRQLIPMDTNVPAGAETFVYDSWEGIGAAKIIADYADDLPMVSAMRSTSSGHIRMLGAAYEYTVQALQRAAFSGHQLETKRAMTVRRAHEFLFDEMLAVGHAPSKINGLLNFPGVPIVAPVTGQWITNNATAAQIVVDLNALVNQVVTSTNGVFPPNILILPQDAYTLISSQPMSSTGDTTRTILTFFLETNPHIQEVKMWLRANDAGVGNTSRAMAYMRDPEVVSGIEAMPFTQFPAQARNLAFVVPTASANGGVIMPHPLGGAYMDDLAG